MLASSFGYYDILQTPSRLMQAATNPELLRKPLMEFAFSEGIDLSSIHEDTSFMHQILHYQTEEIPSKYRAAYDLIQIILEAKQKVVVWASFILNIESLQMFLSQKGIKSKTIFGGTPIAKDGISVEDEGYESTREAIINEFNSNNSSFNVLIANPFAVAESISLHKACHNAIYLERTFNAAHYIQSKDRIHRYGLSKETVTNYYYIISENSIDEVIHDRLIFKENRLLEMIEAMPIPLFSNAFDENGDEDIKALLRNYASRNKKV